MGGPGGKRPGAGRPKGSLGQRTKLMQAAIEVVRPTLESQGDITPMAFLLAIMRHPDVHPAIRIECAKACLPYSEPRIEPVPRELDRSAIGATQHRVVHMIEAAPTPSPETMKGTGT